MLITIMITIMTTTSSKELAYLLYLLPSLTKQTHNGTNPPHVVLQYETAPMHSLTTTEEGST
jgi:hypothetical protein